MKKRTLVSVYEAARLCGLTPESLYRAIRMRRLAFVPLRGTFDPGTGLLVPGGQHTKGIDLRDVAKWRDPASK